VREALARLAATAPREQAVTLRYVNPRTGVSPLATMGAEALWLDAYEHAAGAGPFYMKCGFRKVGRTQYREVPLGYFEWLVASQAHTVRAPQ